jgi:hypothetical protein
MSLNEHHARLVPSRNLAHPALSALHVIRKVNILVNSREQDSKPEHGRKTTDSALKHYTTTR